MLIFFNFRYFFPVNFSVRFETFNHFGHSMLSKGEQYWRQHSNDFRTPAVTDGLFAIQRHFGFPHTRTLRRTKYSLVLNRSRGATILHSLNFPLISSITSMFFRERMACLVFPLLGFNFSCLLLSRAKILTGNPGVPTR